MASQTIRIIVEERGIHRVTTGLRGMSDAGLEGYRAMRLLRTALGALSVGFLVREYARLSDEYTTLSNRIRLVTENDRARIAVQERLLEVANETRLGLAATSELYVRIALNTRHLGVTQERVLRVTKALNQAVILSGATAQESRNALIQLSQGLASNSLRGDELRAVLEQLPFVADIIAKKLGVVRGALRLLAFRGQVDAKVILEAFEEAADQIDEDFRRTIPTISQSLTILRNEFQNSIGTFNRETGVSASVAEGIKKFAEIVRFAFGVVTILVKGLLDLVKTSSTVSTALKAIGFVLGSLVFVAVTAAIVGLTGKLLLLAISATAATKVFGLLLAVLSALTVVLGSFVFGGALFDKFKEVQIIAADFIAGAQSVLLFAGALGTLQGGRFPDLADLKRQLTEIADTAVNTKQAIDQQFKGGNVNSLGLTENPNTKTIPELLKQQFGDLTELIKKAKKEIDDLFNIPRGPEGTNLNQLKLEDLRDEVVLQGQIVKLQADESVHAARALASLQLKKKIKDENINLDDETSQKMFKELDTLVRQNAELKIQSELKRQLRDFNRDLDQEIELLQLGTQEREVEADLLRIINTFKDAGFALTRTEIQALREKRQTLQDLKVEEELLNEIYGDRSKIFAQMQAIDKLRENSIDPGLHFELSRKQAELRIQSRQGIQTFEAGTLNAFDRIFLKVTDVAGDVENALVNAFQSAEDALVSFVQTGEFDFGRLIDSILGDLTRLLFHQAFKALFASAGGETGGGVAGTILGGIFGGGKAEGGPVKAGTPYVVGEQGPEIFQPSTSGTIIPNDAIFPQMSAPQVKVTVVNVHEPDIASALNDDAKTDQVIINKLGRNRAAARRVLGL